MSGEKKYVPGMGSWDGVSAKQKKKLMKISKAIRDREEALVMMKREWVEAAMAVNILQELIIQFDGLTLCTDV